MTQIDRTPLRRRALLLGLGGAAVALAVRKLPAQQASMQEKPSTGSRANLTALHYELDFAVPPQRIYRLLLDATQFAAMTGMAAAIDATVGGAFALFGKMIEGRMVELVENARVVQAWRPASWDPGVYSIAHFELKARGSESTLIFDHTGFPSGLADHLDAGWKGHYWEPMKKFFAHG